MASSSSTSASISIQSESSADSSTAPSDIRKPHKIPAQDKIKQEINEHRANIQSYLNIPNLNQIMREQLKKEKAKLTEKEKKIHQMQLGVQRAQKCYKKKNDCLKRAAAVNPDDAEIAKYSRAKHGRPSLEDTQPGFLNTLKEIVQLHLGGTDERRRSEVIRTVRTLKDLKEELENHGFKLSATGLYYHLLPK